MKRWKTLAALGACSVVLVLAQQPAHDAASGLPHFEKNGPTLQMLVDGRPYLMLAGELHNSSASSPAYMKPVWDKLAGLNVNTVIGTASWELVEPVEGQFDFTAVDAQVRSAEEHGMRLVLIWFGTWKNASSSYVPMWVKRNVRRFPMASTKSGTGSFMGMRVDSLSALGPATVAADAKAFRALMHHLRESDPRHTVIMVQVENEAGLLGDSRDRSPLAEEAWSKPVPRELLGYLEQREGSLLPELSRVWAGRGFRTAGTWAEVFGTDPAAEEVFMAWHIGRAVETVAEAGKAELPIPMYANAWLGPQPRQTVPGQYPSGGPVAGMLDIWRAAAPHLDLFAPDIYVADFQGVCELYARSGNPLFIPEARTNIPNLFWAVAHHATLGYSPFGIEDIAGFKPLAEAYAMLGSLAPVLLKYQAEGKVMAVIEGHEASVRQFEDGTGLLIKFGDPRAAFAPAADQKTDQQKDLSPAPAAAAEFSMKPDVDKRGFALVIVTAPEEFVIAGSNVVITSSRSHLGRVDEGRFEKGRWIAGRRLNGDETFSANFFALSPNTLEMRRVMTYPVQ